jgi:predicted phosphodiesterase
MNVKKVDFVIELGDFKDNDEEKNPEKAIQNLQVIESVFQQFHGPVFYVLGNHDLDSNSKKQFFDNVRKSNIFSGGKGYYSFTSGSVHCIVLDANFRSNGTEYSHGNFDWKDANIPYNELVWLEEELATAKRPVIIFIHQLLDGKGNLFVRNAEYVRKILEDSGKILAVFQGHHHFGRYRTVANIHYYTSKAVVEGSGSENNAYEIVEVFADLSMTVTGYRKAESREFMRIQNT